MANNTAQEAGTSADVAAKAWLKIAAVEKLASSSRHHLTLRHPDTQEYHSLLIFSFPAPTSNRSQLSQEQQDDEPFSSSAHPTHDTYYCMEATCPHLGAPLENATIEANDAEFDDDDIEDMVVVCPWHEYDFSLSTGESSHGISACVYQCDVRKETLFIEAPKPAELSIEAASKWELIELRPVSEASPAVSQRQDAAKSLDLQTLQMSISDDYQPEPHQSNSTKQEADKEQNSAETIAPPCPRPKTLVEWAVLVLNTPDPVKKVAYTRFAAKAFQSGECKVIGGGRWNTSDASAGCREWITKPQESAPERPPRMKEEVRVRPGQEGKRGRGGTEKSRIAILHSLANIEQWAIDLAWDIIARAPKLCAEFFAGDNDNQDGPTHKMPLQFF